MHGFLKYYKQIEKYEITLKIEETKTRYNNLCLEKNKLEEQIDTLEVLVVVGLTFKFRVATLSHPAVFNELYV